MLIEGVGRRSFSSGQWGEPGTPTEVGQKSLNGYERNVLFWNRGDERFAEVAYAAGVNRIEDGRALAIADLDRDGRLDLVLNNFDRAARILMSRGPDRAWLQVELEGTRSSRDAVGAEVRVHAPGARQSRQIKIGGGYLARSSTVLHFGLGDADRIDRIEIRWPSGLVEEYRDVRPRQRVRYREGDGRRAEVLGPSH